MDTDKKLSASVLISVRPWLIIVIALFICFSFGALAADAEYKQVLITAGTNFVRVRLPLTDVTGKVRVKEKSADGFGLPLAPSKTVLGKKHYLEWQIGYDTPNADDPTVVPKIKFSLEESMEYIQGDEYVEITPLHIRLRKIHLDENERKRLGKKLEAM